MDFKLVYSGTTFLIPLIAYTNVDYTKDLYYQKSQNKHILFLNGRSICQGSKKQACLIDSTTYSKYIAYYMATKKIF